MNITCISDTHNLHEQLVLPKSGDVLIHAGDFTEAGTKREVKKFFDWFSSLPFTHKICISGNHDFYLENLTPEELEQIIPKNIYYLLDSGITINGINFWGSPYIPSNHNWAFTKLNSEIETHWKKIPDDTHVLITHTPPKGILDETNKQIEIGCAFLREEIKLKKPNLHVFGHLHENYGKVSLNETIFINATSFINDLKITNHPIQVNFPD